MTAKDEIIENQKNPVAENRKKRYDKIKESGVYYGINRYCNDKRRISLSGQSVRQTSRGAADHHGSKWKAGDPADT